MNVTVNSITGFEDAFVAMYMSKIYFRIVTQVQI